MKNILVLAQKGGVGKTLIADELAYSLERTGTPFSFYELDSQDGNRHSTTENTDADIAVIDTPGYLQDDVPDMIEDAAVIVVPTRASAADQPSLLRMRQLIQTNAPSTPTILVVNGWNRFGNTAAFMEWLESDLNKNETIIIIPQSEAVPQSIGGEESVTTYAPRTKAAAAVRKLTNAVRGFAGLENEPVTPTKSRKGKKNG